MEFSRYAPQANKQQSSQLPTAQAPEPGSIEPTAQADLVPTAAPFIPRPDPAPSIIDNNLDEFAQTRPPDDLFSDDFEPISDDEPAQPPQIQETATPPTQKPANNQSQRGSRGRGARRAGGGHGGLAPRGGAAAATAPAPAVAAPEVPAQGSTEEGTPAATATQTTAAAADGPKKTAVRGDRSGTGGVKKAKLTEEELSQRMEAIKLKNASLEAAHARAEADEASFKEREAHAEQGRRIERQNRQQMMGEREKNRLRKLGALQGREWDAQKDERESPLDSSANRSQFRRGAFGGVAPDARTTGDAQEDVDAGLEDDGSRVRGGGRGRGRGRGRGHGRGRGGFDAPPNGRQNPSEPAPQAVPEASDFPALPSKAVSKSDAAPESSDSPLAPGKGGSWAEEMESSPAVTTTKS